jgi:hypothetical protein
MEQRRSNVPAVNTGGSLLSISKIKGAEQIHKYRP